MNWRKKVLSKECREKLTAIKTIIGDTNIPYHIANIVQDINNWAWHIDNISFNFCPRSANQAANRLAKFQSRYCMFYTGF